MRQQIGSAEAEKIFATLDHLFFVYAKRVLDLPPPLEYLTTPAEQATRNATEGSNLGMLGNMCLVFFYPCWEETIRRDIATLHGVEESEIKSQIWGDIGKIRNAIPHHRAIATKEVGKCAILKWFYEGEPIWVTPQFFTQLCEELTRFNAGTKHLLPARADNPRPNALHLGFHALFVLNLALALRLRFG